LLLLIDIDLSGTSSPVVLCAYVGTIRVIYIFDKRD